MEGNYELRYLDDPRGRPRVEVFLRGLGPECQARAVQILTLLKVHGLDLSSNPKVCKRLRGRHNVLWELRKMCPQGAIRFYFWPCGERQFMVACGELKTSRSPDTAILSTALNAYNAWRDSLN